MNAEVNHNHGSGNWIAFLFGAIFNLLSNINLSFLLDYALQAVVGGIICLAFKVIGDVFSPLWLKHREKVKEMARKSIQFGRKKSRRKGDDKA